MVRNSVTAALSGSVLIANSVLRVMSDTMAGLAHLVLRYIDWLSLQLLPDTAETEWLDRHGDIWLVNADGTTGRKAATYAQGTVSATGQTGFVIPTATQLDILGITYETTADVTIGDIATTVPARSLTAGAIGNADNGTAANFITPISGIDAQATVIEMTGGTDTETDDQLRARVLLRIRNPPMGGDEADYVVWALAVPGVTRAWAASEMGIGTITVRFLMDDLRASDNGWPTPTDVQTVATYIDQMRPVTVKDCYVLAPIKQFIDITISHLVPDTTEAQTEVQQAILNMLFQMASPGQTIYSAWISAAIMQAPSVISFDLVTNADFVMPNLGTMAVLGTILYQ
jgi:uncharacterized phage protein gp47/JayE